MAKLMAKLSAKLIAKLRILLVDDHEVVRKGVRALLDRPDWEVCGETDSAAEAVRKTKQLNPDIVVLDLALPDASGLNAITEILQVQPKTAVLVLTMRDSGETATQVLAAGARGLVLKSDAARDIVAAVKAISQGRRFLSPRVTEIIAGSLASNRQARIGSPHRAAARDPGAAGRRAHH